MKKWEFELGANVHLALSGEEGVIIARSEAVNVPDQYRIRYLAADGRQVEDWFFTDAFKAA